MFLGTPVSRTRSQPGRALSCKPRRGVRCIQERSPGRWKPAPCARLCRRGSVGRGRERRDRTACVVSGHRWGASATSRRRAPHSGPNGFNLGTTGGNRGFTLDVIYERAVSRRLSLGAALSYAFPPTGFGHLQGFGERVHVAVWPWQAGRGFFGRASFGVRHQVFARDARIRITALAPGIDAGWRWRLRHGFNVGLLAGLHWLMRVEDDPRICTRAAHCPSSDPGVDVRAGLDVGCSF